jgi:hypothetical protein
MHRNETPLDPRPRLRAERVPGRWWKVVPVLAAAVVFVGLVPILEINDSHLFNPDWPAHARFHEAWQLLTNAALGIAATWLLLNGRERLGAGIALLIVGPLLSAYAFRGLYGGSISRDGGEDAIFTIGGAPALVMLIIAAGLTAVLAAGAPVLRRRRTPDVDAG